MAPTSNQKVLLSSECRLKIKQHDMMFFVTTASDIVHLGRQACVQLDLIRKVDALTPSLPDTKTDLLNRFESVFQGLGQ